MDRLLGPEEFKFWLFDRRAPFNVVASAQIAGRLDVGALQIAASSVAARHPALRARVVLQGRPRLVSVEVAPPRVRLIPREDDDHWRRECEGEFALPVPLETGPPWRLSLLDGPDSSDLILTISHVIADGTSILLVVRDLLMALGGEPLAHLPELPAGEALIAPEAFGSLESARLVAGWWSRATARRLEQLDYEALVENLPAVGATRLRSHELTVRETGALIERCRAEGTTVQGALGAAMLLSLTSTSSRELSLLHIVNLRSRLAPPVGEDVGVYISHVSSRHVVHGETPFWELARDVRHQLVASLDTSVPFENVARTLRVLAREGPVDDELCATAAISNPGRIAVEPRYGSLRVDAVRMGGAALVDAPVVETVTFADRIGCLFIFPGRWNRLAEADSVCREFVARLVTHCAESGQTPLS